MNGGDHRNHKTTAHRLDRRLLHSMTHTLGAAATLLLGLGYLINPVQAQISADGTVNTAITSQDNRFTITKGTTAGTNLFHSFSEFSVPTGGEAYFNNANNIETIFSRVTGGNLSTIDGVVRANGTASLFLINPAGIVFNENASLNLRGSFVGTTAEQVVFSDGAEFSAVQTTPSPLLTVSAPVGLQLGPTSGDITVNNIGHEITGSSNFSPIFNPEPDLVGLQTAPGQSLVLMGSNLTLDGGILTAPSGHIELSAVGRSVSPFLTRLQRSDGHWSLDYGTGIPLGNIHLSQRAFVNASGMEAGSIQIRGGNLTLQDGSLVLINNLGTQHAGAINVNIANTINVNGVVPGTSLRTGIYSELGNSGNGSDITVQAETIFLEEGGNIQSRTFSSGQAGHLMINATNVELIDNQANGIVSFIGSRTLSASGDANNIVFNVQRLHLNGGGVISASTAFGGSGDSGNIVINASDAIELSVFPGNNNDAIISASTIAAAGNGGDIIINTPRLSLEGGAVISSSTFGSGRGGTIMVNATESVTLRGNQLNPLRLTQEGSTIRTAGILLPAFIREVSGFPEQVTGAAGDVVINTPKLDLIDGGAIVVRHDSVGNTGNIQITADAIALSDQGQITANTTLGEGGNITVMGQTLALSASSLTATTGSGNGGNLNIRVGDLLSLRDHSLISTTAGQTGAGGNGGNINLSAPLIVGFANENSDITANAFEGSGGNIQVTTDGLFGIAFRNTPTSASDITASSRFGVDGVVTIETPDVDPQQGLVSLPTALADVSHRIAKACETTVGQNSFAAIGRTGLPADPRQPLHARLIWQDQRIGASAQGQVPTPSVTDEATKIQLTEAEAWAQDAQGRMHLVAQSGTGDELDIVACLKDG